MEPLVRARNLTKTIRQGQHDILVLDQVDIDIFPNQVLAITGASGSGKSTLLNILGTLDAPTSGEIHFFGSPLSSYRLPRLRNKHIGFVFQNFYLLEDDSVMNNVLIPAGIARTNIMKGSEAYEKAEHLLHAVNLSNKMHARCSHLSGGEKQRVAIARALINDPSILLADEPSGNLDAKTSSCIHELLLSQANAERSVLLVTHNKELAQQCHKEFVLLNGKLQH